MKNSKFGVFISTFLFVVMSTNALATDFNLVNYFKKKWEEVKPLEVDQKTRDWLKDPTKPVKAQIYTGLNPSESLELVTDKDGMLIFEACACGKDNCYPILEPQYKFTIDELINSVSTSRGILRATTPIGVGVAALILSAVAPATIAGAAGALGSALDPQSGAQQYGTRIREEKQIAKQAKEAIKRGEAIQLPAPGSFQSSLLSYESFLRGIKSQEGTAKEKADFNKDLQQWHEDVRQGKKPGLKTCESVTQDKLTEALDDIKTLKTASAETNALLKQTLEELKRGSVNATSSDSDVQRAPTSSDSAISPLAPTSWVPQN